MREIVLTHRKLNKTEQIDLVNQLKAAYDDDENGCLVTVKDDHEDEPLEAVLVPLGMPYDELFREIIGDGAVQMDFNWDDTELSAQLGLCIIQHALGGKRSFLLGNDEDIYFALVSRDLFEEYE